GRETPLNALGEHGVRPYDGAVKRSPTRGFRPIASRQAVARFLAMGPELLETGFETVEAGDVDVRVGGDETFGDIAGAIENAGFEALVEPAELGKTALASADKIAGAAQLEIAFGEDEAVVGGDHRLQAGAAVHRNVVGEKQAVAFTAAPPDATTELVKLGEAEPIGALDHHHRGVRDVDADLDDGGGDKNV